MFAVGRREWTGRCDIWTGHRAAYIVIRSCQLILQDVVSVTKMKNPIKKLRDRLRNPSSRVSRDFQNEGSPELRTTSAESESLVRPTDSASRRSSHQDDATPAVIQEEQPVTPEKKGIGMSRLLDAGKTAVAKTVTFAREAPVSTPTSSQTRHENPVEEEDDSSPATVAEVVEDRVAEDKDETPLDDNTEEDENANNASQDTTPPVSVPPVRTTPDNTSPAETSTAQTEEGNIPAPPDPVSKKDVEGKVYHVHAKSLLLAIMAVVSLFWLMVIRWLGVNKWETVQYSVLTFAAVLGYRYLYTENVKRKMRQVEALNTTPGVKGMKALLKDLPTWLSYRKKDRVEWLNKALSQMWPSYDKAICAAIKVVTHLRRHSLAKMPI